MSIKLHNYACDLLDKMERGGRLQQFEKELVKTVLDRDELEFIKAPKCSCCGQPLGEDEQEPVDCGHLACNKCSSTEGVRKGLNRTVCGNCADGHGAMEE